MVANTPSWPTPQIDAETTRAIAAYEELTKEERQRAARLQQHTGCTLALAVAAVVATRPQR